MSPSTSLYSLVSEDDDLYIKERIWKRHRQIKELEKRDSHIGCRICRTENNLTIDHIIPKALKGQNIMSNKQVLCSKCNNLKGNMTPGKNGWWPDDLMDYLNSFLALISADD